MPVQAEIKELIDNCLFTRGEYNGVRGQFVSGPNGNSIFLPYTGYGNYDKIEWENSDARFWSGTRDKEEPDYADVFGCSASYGASWNSWARRYGLSVRPVKDK